MSHIRCCVVSCDPGFLFDPVTYYHSHKLQSVLHPSLKTCHFGRVRWKHFISVHPHHICVVSGSHFQLFPTRAFSVEQKNFLLTNSQQE